MKTGPGRLLEKSDSKLTKKRKKKRRARVNRESYREKETG